ncbi:protein RKD4-like [Ipomoea triloba]|uniref:protein RKD4-like n=1 Tax=Ipomoea triloba TaxID=35885 RepID=UPI00125E661D|nr:protein RKD4-like [Ipomoea triloba]
MANYVSSSSHSHSLSCSDFEDTSFWNELNLPSLLQIENELYTLLEPSVEGEQVIDAEPVAQVVPPVLPKPLEELEDEDDKEIPISSPEQDYRPFFNHAENHPLDYHFNNPTSSPTGKTLHQIQQSCCSAEQLDFDWGLVNDMLCGQNDVSLEAPPVVAELSNSTEIIVFDKRTSKHWGLNTISKFFHLPAAQAARELNVSEDKLKRMCTKLGIKRWPYRKLQSMDNLLENLQYLSKDKTYAVNKEKVIEF